MENLVDFVQSEFVAKNEIPDFAAGDTITVYFEIKEGVKTRTQFFKGVVIQRRGSGSSETFTIRKMSGTIGVERIFPINLPAIQKIEVNKKGKVRRARIYYFRNLTGKKAQIKEKRF
ncbi:50S ribosomal protein L19 [Lutimonas vermicola]|uniref:Large ribosomal subunit protein bL19 n=1 Tax=Lutimonas vermicola TaxID=414288 RepID=A0ABU9KYV8_9FLAO